MAIDWTQLQGAILDLDGTLLDSMPFWHSVDLDFLTELGVTPPQDISEIVGKMTITESAHYFIDTFSLGLSVQSVIEKIEAMAMRAYCDTLPLKDGVIAFLNFLDSYHIPYGVATANYKRPACAALTRTGIFDRMQFVLSGEDIREGKRESPRIYQRGAELLGIPVERTLVVEDALHCIETANCAGFVTLGIGDEGTPFGDWEKIQAIATMSVRNFGDIAKI